MINATTYSQLRLYCAVNHIKAPENGTIEILEFLHDQGIQIRIVYIKSDIGEFFHTRSTDNRVSRMGVSLPHILNSYCNYYLNG